MTETEIWEKLAAKSQRILTLADAYAIASDVYRQGQAEIAALKEQLRLAQRPQADVYLTVGDTPYAVSKFKTGMQHNDYTLRGGAPTQNAGAQLRARTLVSDVMQVGVTHVHGYGVACPWDRTVLWPTNFGTLDAQVAVLDETSSEKVMVFYGYPYWMREVVEPGGATRPMTLSEQFSDEGRVRQDPQALLDHDEYTYEIAKRYIPKGVLTWVYGNELKGYYCRRDGKPGWDIEEYTNLYNRWVLYMEDAAIDVDVDPSDLRLGGPYVPVRTECQPSAATVAPDHPLYGRPYGEYRRNALEAIEYWLANAARKDFICWDMGAGNASGGEKCDAFTVNQTKFADMAQWVRSKTDLPMILTEFYPKCADDENANPQRVCAAKTIAHLSAIEAGYSGAWLWGPLGKGEYLNSNGALFSDTLTATDPVVTEWYRSYALINEDFGEGANLYPVTIEGEGIYAKVSDTVIVFVNMTGQPKTVCVDDVVYDLGAYEDGWLAR